MSADAQGFYVATYNFVARARQPQSLTMELRRKQLFQQTVEVKAGYVTIDPEKTGRSHTFTQQDLERLPDPLIDTTNGLVNNLMPGASDSHDGSWRSGAVSPTTTINVAKRTDNYENNAGQTAR